MTCALESVRAADRAWFAANPHRSYRLRPATLADIPPGYGTMPGCRVVVVRGAVDGVRFRIVVGKPAPHLRRDTDHCCREIIRRLDAAGFAHNGRRLGEAVELLWELRP
jgi:hypothetical protein